MDINISDEAKELIDEMGENKVTRYMNAYCEFKYDKKKNEDFFLDFSEYLVARKPNKKGYKTISTSSFTDFLFKKYYKDIPDILYEK